MLKWIISVNNSKLSRIIMLLCLFWWEITVRKNLWTLFYRSICFHKTNQKQLSAEPRPSENNLALNRQQTKTFFTVSNLKKCQMPTAAPISKNSTARSKKKNEGWNIHSINCCLYLFWTRIHLWNTIIIYTKTELGWLKKPQVRVSWKMVKIPQQ